MKRKKILIGSIATALLITGGSVSGSVIYSNNKLNEMSELYDRAEFLTENLILSDDVYESYADDLKSIKKDIDGKKYKRNDYTLLKTALQNLEDEKDNSITFVEKKESEVSDLYDELTSEDFEIESEFISDVDDSLEKSAQLKKKEYYKQALQELTTLCGTIEDKTAELLAKEDSTDRLSYEQFLSETGLSDSEEAQYYYNDIYIANINFGSSADLAFEDAITAIKEDAEAANSISNVATTDDGNTSDTETGTGSTSSDGNASSGEDSTVADAGIDNTNTSDDSTGALGLSEAELAARTEAFNGGHLEGPGLTDEERAEEEEAWSTIHGY